MRKLLLPFAALAFAGNCAHAQSSIILYGIADGNVRFDHTSIGTLKSIGSGGESSSRWGLRGTEDLGGGLKAIFNFEQDIDLSDNSAPQGNISPTTPSSPNSSTGSRLFGRRAIVGLNSATFGEIRAGRDYTPFYTAWLGADPFASGLVGRATNIAIGSVTRADNSFTYQTPSYAGLGLTVQYRPGESTTENATAVRRGGDLISGSVTYSAGKLYTAVGYVGARNATNTNNPQAGTAVATYDFDIVKLHALYFYQRDRTSIHRQSFAAGLTVPFGGSWKFLGLVSRIKNQDRDLTSIGNPQRNDANFLGTAVTYALSKRTDVYTSYAKFWNKGGAAFIMQDASNAGLLNATNVPGGFDPWAFQTGVRFLF